VAIVIIGPFFEEVFFRGFLFAGFINSRLGAVGTILLTAAAWSALHFTQYGGWELVGIFAAGAAFGYVRYRTGSVWNTLAMHSFWNLVSMIMLALQAGGVIKM
jgi:membrane protease YdiL (CAAX protease family)